MDRAWSDPSSGPVDRKRATTWRGIHQRSAAKAFSQWIFERYTRFVNPGVMAFSSQGRNAGGWPLSVRVARSGPAVTLSRCERFLVRGGGLLRPWVSAQVRSTCRAVALIWMLSSSLARCLLSR